MAEIWMTVDTALSEVPVNIAPLIDDGDFKTIEDAVAYNAAGMDLRWNFVTTGGAYTSTAVTPTTAGTYDWTHQGDGMYSIEIPASGGASINNDTEGFGWFSGKVTGVLPWRGPIIGFRSAMLNDSLVNGGDFLQVDAVQFSSSTTAADNAEIVFATDFATNYNTTTDTWSVKLANSVTHGGSAAMLELGSTTTTPAFLVANSGGDAARFVSTGGNGDGFHTEGAGNGAGFHVIGTGTAGSAYFETGNIICDGTIASSITGNITGNLSGSVGSVTGAVGSVTGAVGSVTGNVGGNVTGSVGSVAAGGITASSIATGAIDADALAADAVAEIQSGLSTFDPSSSGVFLADSVTHGGTSAVLSLSNIIITTTGGTESILITGSGSGNGIAFTRSGSGDVFDATVAAAIQTEAADALTAYAPALETTAQSILTDTAEIGAAGAGLTEAGGTGDQLTAIPWNASWDAEVQSEVTDALNTALTEAYRTTGATGSVAELLYEIIAHLGEFAISGTTKTTKKLDGSTTAKVYTLDDDTAPTSITETT